jgi:hypothetical protein
MIKQLKTALVLAFAVIVACSFIEKPIVLAPRSFKPAFIGPEGFNDTSKILLVQKRVYGISKGKWNKYLENSFKDNYSGKFVMVSPDEIATDPKYRDSVTYRFVLRDHVFGSETTTYGGKDGIKYENDYHIDYNIYDRISKKTFPLGIETSVPAKAMKAAAKDLDSYLKSK